MMSLNKKIAAIILGLIAVGATTFSLGTSNNLRSVASLRFTDIKNEKGEYVITLTENGFMPEELIMLVGSTVKFVTKRPKPFWPASNLHPSHTIYPEFDPQNPVDSGASWSFQFKKTGTWKYHDHLAPYYTGTIMVEDETKSGQQLLQCRDQECWQDRVFTIFKKQGLDGAFDEVRRLYQQEPLFARSCHEITHKLGHVAYRNYELTGQSPLTPKTAFCTYGFYHGFMDSFVLGRDDPRRSREFCLLTHRAVGTLAPDAMLQCFHGVGHGALKLFAQNFIGNEEKMVAPALEFCRRTTESDLEHSRCASGVFNTIASLYNNNEYGLTLNEKDPLRLCRSQPTDLYRNACYISMNIMLMHTAQGDFAKAAHLIETINEAPLAKPAMLNLAALAGAADMHAPESSHQNIIQICRSLQKHLSLSCVQGYAFGFLEHGEPEREYVKPLNFCGSPILDDAESAGCFEYISGYLAQWYPYEKAKKICDSAVPQEYKTICGDALERNIRQIQK